MGGISMVALFSLASFSHEEVGTFWKISYQCNLNQVVTPGAAVVEGVVSTGTKWTEL